MFPELRGQTYCYVNLDAEAVRWNLEHPDLFAGEGNPLLDPTVCQRMMDEVHRRCGVVWSCGGYLEDRSHLLRESYLKATGNFLHLGVDCTVPQGTRVAVDIPAKVILVDHDPDRDGGWGTRVFLATEGLVLIYAHLQNVEVRPGQALEPGEVFTEVGGPPDNGNWHPHLHVQCIRSGLFHEILLERFHELDGYGPPAACSSLQQDFPDPQPYLKFWS
ncbi:MAG: peptidoglycan DD-metalloendopeptidase family protein [Acidobacteriales bacterium]|nr:peptidoglycan DD-metalloendopeptidase family protein [Terriglobales bacterium]